MAESGEGAAVRHLRPDFDKAMASCQALKALAGTLTDEQMALVARVMANELAKLRQ
jgi:nanoRNase/pAp phosphatase (c-di-AMP/oligoRNAs hydrolase)